MPHLLIAGATGSGKTVCMNSILAGLLMARTPEEMRLLLVDPEDCRVLRLQQTAAPGRSRDHRPEEGGARACAGPSMKWNGAINSLPRSVCATSKVTTAARSPSRKSSLGRSSAKAPKKDEPPAHVPYIVIVVDELADLMLADQVEIENGIARLAQLSRAVGIHMILATQRPSVNVITGTIKANFPRASPSRWPSASTAGPSWIPSGADKLLGRGDMLYLAAGSSKLVRAQGAMTTDERSAP